MTRDRDAAVYSCYAGDFIFQRSRCRHRRCRCLAEERVLMFIAAHNGDSDGFSVNVDGGVGVGDDLKVVLV